MRSRPLASALLLLAVAGCGDDDGAASQDGPGAEVDATLPDAPPLGDAFDLDGVTCGEAALAPLIAGSPVTSSTTGAANVTAGSCGGQGAGEAYYVLSVSEPSDVLLSTEGDTTDFNAAVYLRASCLDEETQLGCAGTGALGDALVVRELAPGLYYAIVDGVGGMEGTFSLSLRLRPVKQSGDACDLEGVLDRCDDGLACMDQGGGARCTDPFSIVCLTSTEAAPGTVLTGTLSGTSALEPSCGEGGAEALYHVDLTSPAFLHAVEEGGGLGAGSTLSFLGPDSCNPRDDLGCDDPNGGLQAVTEPLSPGRYYLVVDGNGPYRIAFGVGENLPPSATCDPASSSARCGLGLHCLSGSCQAIDRVTDMSPNAAFCDAQGPFTRDFVVDGELTVGSTTDVDTFRVTLASGGDLHVETADRMGGCAADTVLEVFAKGASTCSALDGGTPTPLASDDNSGASGVCSSLTLPALAAGTYYLRVRRAGAAGGRYLLLVDFP